MAERKRIAVPISGIDTTTPDHSVTDGKCETLHNLRHTGSAWRNMKDLSSFHYDLLFEFEVFEQAFLTRILYKHLDYYIFYVVNTPSEQGQTDTRYHALYAVKFSGVDEGQASVDKIYKFVERTFDNDTNIHITDIFHFGNILHIMWDDENKSQWYLLTEDKYTLYQIDNIYFTIKEEMNPAEPTINEIDSILMIGSLFYAYVVRAVNLSTQQLLLQTFNSNEAWRGSICYFLAARAEDGSILAQSPLRILSSSSGSIFGSASGIGTYHLAGNLYGGLYCGSGSEPFADLLYKEKRIILEGNYSGSTAYIKPTIRFNVRDTFGKFSENISDVALYCTRIHPLFTVTSMSRALPDDATIPTLHNFLSPKEAYQEEDLPNEPFFFAAKQTIAELTTIAGGKGKSGKFVLDRAVLEHIESKGVLYAPELSEADVISTSRKEINSSLHLFGDITMHFRRVYNVPLEMATPQRPNDYNSEDADKWEKEPKLKYARVLIKSQDSVFQSPLSEMQHNTSAFPLFYQCGSIISYPDYRAFEMIFAEETDSVQDDTFKAAKYQLRSAPGINYAYYIPPYDDSDLKYPIIWPWRDAGYETFNLNYYPTSAVTKGKIWVSKNNNPTALPYERMYTIGSSTNEILAINSAAIEMSDSKFGEFPVYVFTKEGIFAMQSGKETLYSAIVPINYDVIINPNTLAVNGAVLYFTDKGLHALTNQGAKLLSAPIHTAENRIPEWMYTTQMVYLSEWNEVLCTDLPNKKAYVFSLDNNVWSTRDIPEGYILNNDELGGADAVIYNLRNEAEESASPMPFTLTTRPIKLGSMELKRAETIIVRFECKTNQTLNVKVEGSIDTQNWGELRNIQTTTNKDILIRRTPCSVKYLRFTIEGNVTDDIRILAFELEYYERMRHRMR